MTSFAATGILPMINNTIRIAGARYVGGGNNINQRCFFMRYKIVPLPIIPFADAWLWNSLYVLRSLNIGGMSSDTI
jgi:hypothetical protein